MSLVTTFLKKILPPHQVPLFGPQIDATAFLGGEGHPKT
jgi:hypothetical protein